MIRACVVRAFQSCVPSVRIAMTSAVLAGALALAGCYGEEGYQLPTRAMKELSPEMLTLLNQKNMPKDSPVLVRVFKEESELEVWKQDTTGQYQLLKVYPICRWSGELGPKKVQGDRQAPEGFYSITPGLINPNSNYYLAINMGFPNAYDKANNYSGAFLMIHGDCSSAGCYAMTDEQIGEIYSLARKSFLGGQKEIPNSGLPVPPDGGQPRPPPQQSEHAVLENAQGRQRPFRGDPSRTQGRCLRQALRVRPRGRPGDNTPAVVVAAVGLDILGRVGGGTVELSAARKEAEIRRPDAPMTVMVSPSFRR